MQYTYDGIGRVLTSQDQNGLVTTNTYDDVGRLKTVKDAMNPPTDLGGSVAFEGGEQGFRARNLPLTATATATPVNGGRVGLRLQRSADCLIGQRISDPFAIHLLLLDCFSCTSVPSVALHVVQCTF